MSNTNIYQVNQSFLNDIQEKLADNSLTAEQKALLIAGVSKLQQNVDLQSIVTGIMQEGVTEVTDQNQAASTAITTAVGEATTALTDATATIKDDVGSIRGTLPHEALRVGPNLTQCFKSGHGTHSVITCFADETQNRFYSANACYNTTNKLNVNFGYYDADDNWIQLCDTILTGDIGTDFSSSDGIIMPLKEHKDADRTVVCVVFFSNTSVYILREDIPTRLFGITECDNPGNYMAYDHQNECIILYGDSSAYGGSTTNSFQVYANSTIHFDATQSVSNHTAWRNVFYEDKTKYIPLRKVDSSIFDGAVSFQGYNVDFPAPYNTRMASIVKYIFFKNTGDPRTIHVPNFYNAYLTKNAEGLTLKWFEFIIDMTFIPQLYTHGYHTVSWKGTKAISLDQQQKPISAVYLSNDLPPQYNPYVHGLTYLEPIGMLPGTPNRIFSRTATTLNQYFCNVHHY